MLRTTGWRKHEKHQSRQQSKITKTKPKAKAKASEPDYRRASVRRGARVCDRESSGLCAVWGWAVKRVFKHSDEVSKNNILSSVKALRLDVDWQVTIEPFKAKRSQPQNRYLWAALLGDFVEQGFFEGRQFSQEVWHEFLKRQFLPEYENPEETLPGYQKWSELPGGELLMVGSTTKLTKTGFQNYMEKCYAFGCELGVRFSAR